MRKLYDELLHRFPEIGSRISQCHEEGTYELMGHLKKWLAELPYASLTPDITNRLVGFSQWCEEQPRSEDGGDDLFTILVVGLYEPLFQSDKARALLPKLIPLEDLVINADYLRSLVGGENYQKALEYYN